MFPFPSETKGGRRRRRRKRRRKGRRRKERRSKGRRKGRRKRIDEVVVVGIAVLRERKMG